MRPCPTRMRCANGMQTHVRYVCRVTCMVAMGGPVDGADCANAKWPSSKHLGWKVRYAAKGAFTLPPQSAVQKQPPALVPPLLHTPRWATIPTRGAGRTAARGGARSR